MDFSMAQQQEPTAYIAVIKIFEHLMAEYRTRAEKGKMKLGGMVIQYHDLGSADDEHPSKTIELTFDEFAGLIYGTHKVTPIS